MNDDNLENEPFELPCSTTDSQALVGAKNAHRWTLENHAERNVAFDKASHINESEEFFSEAGYSSWQKKCVVFNSMIDEFCAAGVFATSAEELRRRIYCAETAHRARADSSGNPLPADWYNERQRLVLAFELERRFVTILLDDDVNPLYNYQLLPVFASASLGRFAPEDIAGVDVGARFRIQFVRHRTLYFIDLMWGSAWRPDLMQAIIHACFAKEGIRERFIQLPSDGPICEYVFADPAAFRRIAKKYGITFVLPPSKYKPVYQSNDDDDEDFNDE